MVPVGKLGVFIFCRPRHGGVMKSFSLFLFFLLAGVFCSAQNLNPMAQALRENDSFCNAQYSVYAKYQDGPAVIEFNPSARLSPASVLKLYTSAAVLDALGPDYRFETKIYYSGEKKGSKINGDIYIRGGGDAGLGSRRMTGTPDFPELMLDWAQKFKDAGIEKINGNIYADNTIFTGVPVSWGTSYKNIGNYFAAPSDGLSIADNSYGIYFEPVGGDNRTASILKIEPEIKNLRINNFVKPSLAEGENVYVNSVPGSNNVELYGTIGPSSKPLVVYAAMPSPALFLAQSFKQALQDADIKVKGDAALASPYDGYGNKTLLITEYSAPLKDMVTYTNKRSFNLYADSFVRSISAEKNHIGSLSDGVAEVSKYLQKLNIPVQDFSVSDGSGLSRDNIVTCKTTVDLLEAVLKEPYGQVFYDSLPIAGDSDDIGNMSRRLKYSGAAHNARIKTGTLDRVRAHAGYIKDSKGRQLIFCIITNNFYGPLRDIDSEHEKIINALADIGLNTKPARKEPKSKPIPKIINIRGN